MRQNVANVSRQKDGTCYQDEPCPNCRTRGLARAIYGRHLPPIPPEFLEAIGAEPIRADRLYTICVRCGACTAASQSEQERYESLNAPDLDLDDYDA